MGDESQIMRCQSGDVESSGEWQPEQGILGHRVSGLPGRDVISRDANTLSQSMNGMVKKLKKRQRKKCLKI